MAGRPDPKLVLAVGGDARGCPGGRPSAARGTCPGASAALAVAAHGLAVAGADDRGRRGRAAAWRRSENRTVGLALAVEVDACAGFTRAGAKLEAGARWARAGAAGEQARRPAARGDATRARARSAPGVPGAHQAAYRRHRCAALVPARARSRSRNADGSPRRFRSCRPGRSAGPVAHPVAPAQRRAADHVGVHRVDLGPCAVDDDVVTRPRVQADALDPAAARGEDRRAAAWRTRPGPRGRARRRSRRRRCAGRRAGSGTAPARSRRGRGAAGAAAGRGRLDLISGADPTGSARARSIRRRRPRRRSPAQAPKRANPFIRVCFDARGGRSPVRSPRGGTRHRRLASTRGGRFPSGSTDPG